MATRKLTIFIHAFDGSGHLNACIGLAQALTRRGHSVVFLLNAASKGHFAKYNFEEILLKPSSESQGPPSFDEEGRQELISPVKAFARMILNSGILNGKSPLEKIKGEVEVEDFSFAENIYLSSVDFNLKIKAAIETQKPDLIILDHFYVPPAILEANIPWLLQFSSNPLAILNSTDLPPCTSGYPTTKEGPEDEKLWAEFRRYQDLSRDAFIKYQRKLYDHFGYQVNEAEDMPLPGGFFPQCKYGYIYGYPAELDYDDLIDIPEHFIRMDTFCRDEDSLSTTFKLPEGFANESNKLIYFSLGSMGSADVELVKRVTSILSSKTPYKTIVSKGPLADEYELPENCWGEEYLPQTQILPIVDLVITHGGNNTVTETFSFGKPMIIMPLFGDQYDNAQRLTEKGFGRRLETYKFKDQELVDAVEALINDRQLKEKLEAAAKRIATAGSKEKACIKIEAVVEQFRTSV